jgi:hypothetical protein
VTAKAINSTRSFHKLSKLGILGIKRQNKINDRRDKQVISGMKMKEFTSN